MSTAPTVTPPKAWAALQTRLGDLRKQRQEAQARLDVATRARDGLQRAVPSPVEARAAQLLGKPPQGPEAAAKLAELDLEVGTLGAEIEALDLAIDALERGVPEAAREAAENLRKRLAPQLAERQGAYVKALRDVQRAADALVELDGSVTSMSVKDGHIELGGWRPSGGLLYEVERELSMVTVNGGDAQADPATHEGDDA